MGPFAESPDYLSLYVLSYPFPATHPVSHFCRTCQAGWGGLDLPAPLRMRFGPRRRQGRWQGGRRQRAGVPELELRP